MSYICRVSFFFLPAARGGKNGIFCQKRENMKTVKQGFKNKKDNNVGPKTTPNGVYTEPLRRSMLPPLTLGGANADDACGNHSVGTPIQLGDKDGAGVAGDETTVHRFVHSSRFFVVCLVDVARFITTRGAIVFLQLFVDRAVLRWQRASQAKRRHRGRSGGGDSGRETLTEYELSQPRCCRSGRLAIPRPILHAGM